MDATELCVTGWECTESGDKLDSTSTCDGGNQSFVPGPNMLSGSVNGYIDSAVNIFDSPLSLYNGAIVALELFYQGLTGPKFDIPTAYIENVKVGSTVKGLTNFSFNFSSNGTYTLPTGTF